LRSISGGLLVFAGHEIDGDDFQRDAGQRGQQANLVAVAGQFEVVELHCRVSC
jgi:hypothetical protein